MARNRSKKGPTIGPFVFNVYKPVGVTSFDVVRHFKYHLPRGYGKIGHFGTLDPFADGVLLIATGPATRLTDTVHEFPKTYRAKGILGIHSLTGDLTANDDQIEKKEVSAKTLSLTVEELNKLFKEKFIGKYLQVPPHFSATKHEGKSLHEWAREGVLIEKEAVEREIYSLDVLSYKDGEIEFRTSVSSGTYIRTLFEDMAKTIGELGALETLTREKIGPVSIESSMGKELWPERETNENYEIDKYSLGIDEVFDLPKYQIPEDKRELLMNGADVQCSFSEGACLIYDQDRLLALADVKKKRLKFRVRLFIETL